MLYRLRDSKNESNPTMLNKLPINVAKLGPDFPKKMVYTVLAVICVLIGLVGLVVPIIPGLLFMIGAVTLLSQVSTRVRTWSDAQPWMHQVRVQMIQLGGLKPLEKTRFVILLGMKSFVNGLESVWRTCRKLMPR